MRVVGKTLCAALPIEAEHDGRNAIEHVAVVRDQHQRAAIFEQAFFEYLEGRNVEIVGGLIEQKHIGGLKHELRDQHARPFASGEAADGLIELLAGEQESCRPRRDVNHAVLIDHGIAVRSQRAAQSYIRIELASLIEVHDSQPVGSANFSSSR